MHIKRITLSALICGACWAVPVSAADLFESLDSNSDGLISADELTESQQPFFERALRVADRDLDGQLTRSELNAALTDPKPVTISTGRRPGFAAFDLTSLDRNKDGFVAKEEVPPQAQERLQRVFDEYSNKIPVDVLRRFQAMQQQGSPAARPASPRPARTSDGNSQPMSQDDKSMKTDARPVGSAFFDQLDANSDDRLTANELTERLKQNLRRMDENNDQAISRAEFQKAMSRLRRQP